jgi:hypothetical protein
MKGSAVKHKPQSRKPAHRKESPRYGIEYVILVVAALTADTIGTPLVKAALTTALAATGQHDLAATIAGFGH